MGRPLIVVLTAPLLPGAPVHAATTSTTFTVSATVNNNCTTSATNLDFGSYNTLSATPADAANSVTVTCTTGAAYTIGLDAGTGAGATVAIRKLSLGGSTLNYTLYQDAARTTVWGNTVNTNTNTVAGTGLAVVHNVYGRISALQNVGSGAYADTITVAVTY